MTSLCNEISIAASWRTSTQVQAFFDSVRRLARTTDRDLEIAMLVAWLGDRDPEDLGYGSLSAFYAEHVDWRSSWRKAMVALVRSDLDLVKQAALKERVPLRIAVRAPGNTDRENQEAWLASCLEREHSAPEPRGLDTHEGDEAAAIAAARRVARICMGRAATEREVDEWLMERHREEATEAAILEEARRRPPRPVRKLVSWAWCPWAEPGSIADARARLDQLQAIERGRLATLARAWTIAKDDALWAELPGDAGPEELANDVFCVSLRQAQRIERLGWALIWYPELDAAIRAGLAPRSAMALATVVEKSDLQRWLDVAARVGRREFQHAVREAREAWDNRPVLAAYEAAFALAKEVTTSAGPVQVALPHPEPDRPRRPVCAPTGLLAAATWWNKTVKLPPQRGTSRVKVRDGFTCQNPWCGRTSLRCEAHHVVFQSEGGSDDPDNLITVCRACHLRGLHGGRLTVERHVVRGQAAYLWRHADGRQVVVFAARPRT